MAFYHITGRERPAIIGGESLLQLLQEKGLGKMHVIAQEDLWIGGIYFKEKYSKWIELVIIVTGAYLIIRYLLTCKAYLNKFEKH